MWHILRSVHVNCLLTAIPYPPLDYESGLHGVLMVQTGSHTIPLEDISVKPHNMLARAGTLQDSHWNFIVNGVGKG